VLQNNIQDIVHTPHERLNFEASHAFWEGLFGAMKEQDTIVTYGIEPEKDIKQTNMYEYTIHETLRGLRIKPQDGSFEAIFENLVKVESRTVNGMKKIHSVKSCVESTVNYRKIHEDSVDFADLLPFPVFAKEFRKLVAHDQNICIDQVKARNTFDIKNDEFPLRIPNYINSSMYYKNEYMTLKYANTNKIFDNSPGSPFLMEIYAAMLPSLQQSYPKWDVVTGLYQLLYMIVPIANHLTYMNAKLGYKDFSDLKIWTESAKYFFGCDISEAHAKFKRATFTTMVTQYSPFASRMKALYSYRKIDFNSFMKRQLFPELYDYTTIHDLVREKPNASTTFEIILYGDTCKWLTFVQDISTRSHTQRHSSTNTPMSNIYILKLEHTTEQESNPNPDYQEWEALMDRMKEKTNVTLPPAPPKTLTTLKKTCHIATDHVNTTFKHMENLYLRQADKQRLMNCLIQYKENKDLLQSLGIPNKLGIMLHGEPGTGKSSTIHAIASFLNKNIYYIQLNEVKTNQELRMLFDHVTKNCADGGIIVMEDIDAMTDVVHVRSTSHETGEREQTLTLEFFLNILQGSLTTDNTIFITTTNHLEKLDPAFYRDGRFDVNIEMKKADHYQIAAIYKRFFGRDIPSDLLANIPECAYTPATCINRFREFLLEPTSDDSMILQPFLQSI